MDRNFILAAALSFFVIVGWQYFVVRPQMEAAQQAQAARKAAEAAKTPAQTAAEAVAAPKAETLESALAMAPGRVPIDAAEVDGSINLKGAKIDDLRLKNYRETLDPKSPEIRVLSPAEFKHGHYVQDFFVIGADADPDALWSARAGAKLTEKTPVTLTRRSGDVVLEKTIAIDEHFMFTVSHRIRNEGTQAVDVQAYGRSVQYGIEPGVNKNSILHEGPIAIVEKSLLQRPFNNKKFLNGEELAQSGLTGWAGITSKYWLAAVIPPQGEAFDIVLRNIGTPSEPVFSAGYKRAATRLEPGKTLELTVYRFAGAKDVDILRSYQAPAAKGGLGIIGFDRAVDWGNFWFLTRPIFATLDFLGDNIGNWGLAILALTCIIRLLVFPFANGAYEMTAKMKKAQPQMEAAKAQYSGDPAKMQQEMMAIYKKEKINPVTGCLPIFLQMPIFYALYKSLFVTIELRHQPFFGYIQDLSAPDPTNIFNLFGVLPFDPTTIPLIGVFLHIGFLPLLYGVAMWLQMKLSPPPQDPIQAQVFAIMPWMMIFLFAPFAVGLVIYWLWSTVISIFQQIYFMRKHNVEIDWKENFRPPWVKKPAAKAASAAK